jgi:hypothetical protein
MRVLFGLPGFWLKRFTHHELEPLRKGESDPQIQDQMSLYTTRPN